MNLQSASVINNYDRDKAIISSKSKYTDIPIQVSQTMTADKLSSLSKYVSVGHL